MTELATLGGGCFWCLEAIFEELKGVDRVVSGYAGGHVAKPTYRAVCSGSTGHAEVVQVSFDPTVIRYRDLLEVFFVFHDPTTLNAQGPDEGTQYRSAIFYHSLEQMTDAEAVIAAFQTEGIWPQPIVTEVVPLDRFYPAEPSHQGYFRTNPDQAYCRAWIAPKVGKLRSHLTTMLRRS